MIDYMRRPRRNLHTPDGRVNIEHPHRGPQTILTVDQAHAANARAQQRRNSVRLVGNQSVVIGRVA
jgi:hypothetical protein